MRVPYRALTPESLFVARHAVPIANNRDESVPEPHTARCRLPEYRRNGGQKEEMYMRQVTAVNSPDAIGRGRALNHLLGSLLGQVRRVGVVSCCIRPLNRR